MKRKILIASIIIIVIVAIIFLVSQLGGQQFDADNANREMKISWEEVNLRSKHSPSAEIVDTLYEGDTVILTGYSYEYLGGEGKSGESWVEVITHKDGVSGWIVTESVDW